MENNNHISEQFSQKNNTEQSFSQQRSAFRENNPADHLRLRDLDMHTGLYSDPGGPDPG